MAIISKCQGAASTLLRRGSSRPVRTFAAFSSRASSSASGYNFCTSGYISAFGSYPVLDGVELRKRSIKKLAALEASLPSVWGDDDPIRTMINGKAVGDSDDEVVDSLDAFWQVNGRMIHGSAATVDKIIAHLKSYVPPRDVRREMREIEAKLLSTYAADLVANQAADFRKQDGVTELEESIEANYIERQLNDMLLADEKLGRVSIGREAAFIACVSNFSNFLDLFRKVIRNLELGVPCVVLSRADTGQHMYRWFQMLNVEMGKMNVCQGLLTYASCDRKGKQRIMAACQESPLYITCSREVAIAIKAQMDKTCSSTGGPNTMVATELTPGVQQAARWSLGIENSGQCTAMRHLVAPNMTLGSVDKMLAPMAADTIKKPGDSLQKGGFAGMYFGDKGGWGESFDEEVASGYTNHTLSKVKAAYRVGTGEELPYGIEEHWRRLYLDVTSPATTDEMLSDAFVTDLSHWLVTEQPITLAINGDSAEDGYPLVTRIFEQTGLLVYSVGEAGDDTPAALTAQARPQDGEIFGEIPPRRQLTQYTRFPTVVPSSTPSYNSEYTHEYLHEQADAGLGALDISKVVSQVESKAVRGYLRILADYLLDACGPKNNLTLNSPSQVRTALWGLQRPPMNSTRSIIRVDDGVSFDDIASVVLPFWCTNSRSQLLVSCSPAAKNTANAVAALGGVDVEIETSHDFESSPAFKAAWNVIRPDAGSSEEYFPMSGQAMSLLFCLGHIKSTKLGNEHFVKTFAASRKWLRCRDELQ